MVDEPYKDEGWLRERWFSERLISDIADEAGCTSGAVSYWALEKFGFPKKKEVKKQYQPFRDEDWLRERWFSDMTVQEIADEAGCSIGPIKEYASEYGFPNKIDADPTREYRDPDLLRRLYYDEGMTLTEMADRFGVTDGNLSHLMDDYGIERRPSHVTRRLRDPDTGFSHANAGGYELMRNGEEYAFIHRLVAVAEYGFDAVCGNFVHHGKESSRLPAVPIPWANWRENLELVADTQEHADRHNWGSHMTAEDVADRERNAKGQFVGQD